MKIVTRTAAAALLISMPMALGACGSDGGSKPSKDDVKAGMYKAVKSETGTSGVQAGTLKKYSDCIVDKSYDKLGNKALNTMKDGDTNAKTKVSKDDEKTFDSAVESCKSVVTKSAS